MAHLEQMDFQQNVQLTQFQQNQKECTIITVNGVHNKGIIEAFDKFVVLLRVSNGKTNMIYKHAISTIRT